MPISLERVEVYYKHKQEYLDLKKQHPGKLRELPPLEPKTEAERAQQNTVTMPVHPKEEETEGNLTDKVAKESGDSNASTHKIHSEAHAANLGPVKADNLPEPASKEELKKRTEELNK